MVVSAPPRAQLDDEARKVAVEALEGLISNQQARRLIAIMVSTSPVLNEVAARHGHCEQDREDLAESLRARLVDVVLGEPDGFFDPHYLLKSSLTGWIRQTALSFAPSDPTIRRRSTKAIPVAMVGDGQGDIEAASPPVSPVDATLMGTARERLVDASLAALDAGERKRHMADRPWLAATAMRRVLRLPRVCVPLAAADRQWTLDALAGDHGLAARSLRTMLDLAAGFDHPGDVDERVLSLWDDFSTEQMARLADYPDTTAYVIAVGQVRLAPKPSRVAMRAMRKELRDVVGPSAAWSTLSATLLGSFVSRVAEHVSSYDANSTEVSRLAMAEEAERLAAMWPDLLEQVTSWPGQPLGSDESDVEQVLWELLLEAVGPAVAGD